MSYVIIFLFFWLDVKLVRFSLGSGKTVRISQFCPMSSEIMSYINIFDTNRKLLAQATDGKYFVSNL